MDKLTKEQRIKNMQAVKSKGSKIETLLAKEFWKIGHRDRENDRTVYEKPDLTFKNTKMLSSLTVNFGTEKIGTTERKTTKAIKTFGIKKLKGTLKETERSTTFC